MSQFSLRLPDSLMEDAKQVAAKDNVSLNQFFLAAISEKMGEMKTKQFFKDRAQNANIDQALDILSSQDGGEQARAGDEIV